MPGAGNPHGGTGAPDTVCRRAMRWIFPIAFAALVAAGCSSTSDSGSTSSAVSTASTETAVTATTSTGTPVRRTSLRVYFLRDGVVAPVGREVPETQAVARAAVAQLIAGPTVEERAMGLRSDVPHDTELRGLTIAGGQATVDLSQPFAEGAEASLSSRFAQVVYTLTQFATVQTVLFEIEGEPMTTVTDGEGTLLDHAPGRTEYETLTPAILVESPLPNETVTTPFAISGTANTFEATFQVEVLDESGKVVGKRFVTATSGSGQRGTFRAQVSADAAPGPIRLVVYEDSAATGKRIHEVELPLRLAR